MKYTEILGHVILVYVIARQRGKKIQQVVVPQIIYRRSLVDSKLDKYSVYKPFKYHTFVLAYLSIELHIVT